MNRKYKKGKLPISRSEFSPYETIVKKLLEFDHGKPTKSIEESIKRELQVLSRYVEDRSGSEKIRLCNRIKQSTRYYGKECS